MPAKSGGSHAIGAFVTLIVGTVLSKYIWTFAPPLGEAATASIVLLRTTAGVSIPANNQFSGMIVVMLGLSFLWGIFYELGRGD